MAALSPAGELLSAAEALTERQSLVVAVADTALISQVPCSSVLVLRSFPLPQIHQDLLAAQWESRLPLSLLRLLRPFKKLQLRLKKLSQLQSLTRQLPPPSLPPLLRSLLLRMLRLLRVQRVLRLLRPMIRRKLSLPSLISSTEAPWLCPPV